MSDSNEKQTPAAEEALYQLRRMVLINVGTNVHMPSGRFAQIDPRGGAAVLGDNGVGKTTNLRLFPLFFGHLPSQLVVAGGGQEALIRFVLPTDASAIAFEYSRGSNNPTDLRMAVIRRRSDDPDVPVYRLYRCGFATDLFVDAGRFLTDEETQQKALERNIQTTARLTSAEYRHVILRTPSASKERDRLRRYSVEWSFGPKSLDNLDRVVAAMLKKHISFADIVQVAIGMAQQDHAPSSERGRIAYKQGRDQIERWLRDYYACEQALQLEDSVKDLGLQLRELDSLRSHYRLLHADAIALSGARAQRKNALDEQISTFASEREEQVRQDAAREQDLATLAEQAHRQAETNEQNWRKDQATANYMSDQDAPAKELELLALPQTSSDRKAAWDRWQTLQSKAADKSAAIDALRTKATTSANDRKLELEREKSRFHERHSQTLDDIAAQQAQAVEGRRHATRQLLAPLKAQREEIGQRIAVLQADIQRPRASDDAIEGHKEAVRQHERIAKELLEAQPRHTRAQEKLARAKQAFDDQQRAVDRAKEHLGQCQTDVAQALERLTAPQGTLLATLRSSPDNQWQKTLARILDPALLQRQDLEATFCGEGDTATAFGWALATANIQAPRWIDDASAAQVLEQATAKEASAQRALDDALGRLAALARAHSDANIAFTTTGAHAETLTRQLGSCKDAVEQAQSIVEKETTSFAAAAQQDFEERSAENERIALQMSEIEQRERSDLQAIEHKYQTMREQAKEALSQALGEIQSTQDEVDSNLKKTLETLDEDLRTYFCDHGIDATAVAQAHDDYKTLLDRETALQELQPLVNQWKKWLADDGPARLARHRLAHEQSAPAARKATEALELHKQERLQRSRAHETAARALADQLAAVESDIEALQKLVLSFDDYLPHGISAIDPQTVVTQLRNDCRNARSKIDEAELSIARSHNKLRHALTAKPSAIKDMVEAAQGDLRSQSDTARAASLCQIYRQVCPQVLTDVNITLRTMLQHIGAFQQAMRSFESEVSAFNRRLQAGLSEVRCFERVTDLRLDIVTHFDGLGFYRKSAALEEAMAHHASQDHASSNTNLPPEATVRALRDFAGVLGPDGQIEINPASHITLRGSVNDNGHIKTFRRSSELENISSEGLTSLILITLMTALLNTIRGTEPVHVPWVTDEVGRFDPRNFRALMQRLKENRIDVVTASPELGPAQQALFANRYLFEDRGLVRQYQPLPQGSL